MDRGRRAVAATAMGADAARKQWRKAATENMKVNLQSAAEVEAAAMGDGTLLVPSRTLVHHVLP